MMGGGLYDDGEVGRAAVGVVSNHCEGEVVGLPFVGVEEAVDLAMFRANIG